MEQHRAGGVRFVRTSIANVAIDVPRREECLEYLDEMIEATVDERGERGAVAAKLEPSRGTGEGAAVDRLPRAMITNPAMRRRASPGGTSAHPPPQYDASSSETRTMLTPRPIPVPIHARRDLSRWTGRAIDSAYCD